MKPRVALNCTLGGYPLASDWNLIDVWLLAVGRHVTRTHVPPWSSWV